MNTLIPTANVVGNIGSCKTEIASVVSDRDFFTLDITNYATNSCTGIVETFQTWEASGAVVIGIVLFVVVLAITGLTLASIYD